MEFVGSLLMVLHLLQVDPRGSGSAKIRNFANSRSVMKYLIRIRQFFKLENTCISVSVKVKYAI
jgi:hypothetical protein